MLSCWHEEYISAHTPRTVHFICVLVRNVRKRWYLWLWAIDQWATGLERPIWACLHPTCARESRHMCKNGKDWRTLVTCQPFPKTVTIHICIYICICAQSSSPFTCTSFSHSFTAVVLNSIGGLGECIECTGEEWGASREETGAWRRGDREDDVWMEGDRVLFVGGFEAIGEAWATGDPLALFSNLCCKDCNSTLRCTQCSRENKSENDQIYYT